MKYFTKDMWIYLQRGKSNYWDKKWKTNFKLYSDLLLKLKPKLSQHAFKFFSQEHMHGEYIINLRIINNGTTYFQPETNEIHFKNNRKNTIEIQITTLCPTNKFHLLNYKNVRKYVIDFPSDQPLWFEGKYGHGTWGYDELSYLGEGFFRHEILLHSGGTILIEFKEFNYSSKKIPKIPKTK